MYNWYDRGVLQVIDKESGETLFEIETTIAKVAYATFNFGECDYQFIEGEYGCINPQYILNTRDIKELRITKVQTPDGLYKYTVLDTIHDSLNERLNKIFKSAVLSLKINRDMIILKTISYTATVCGWTITNAKIEGIAGIITGHDTIFIEVEEGHVLEDVVERIRNLSI